MIRALRNIITAFYGNAGLVSTRCPWLGKREVLSEATEGTQHREPLLCLDVTGDKGKEKGRLFAPKQNGFFSSSCLVGGEEVALA